MIHFWKAEWVCFYYFPEQWVDVYEDRQGFSIGKDFSCLCTSLQPSPWKVVNLSLWDAWKIERTFPSEAVARPYSFNIKLS